MSLREAVNEIVANMEAQRDGDLAIDGHSALSIYVRLLRMALKASETEEGPKISVGPSLTHEDIIARERVKFRLDKKPEERDEGPVLKMAIGGELDGTMLPVPADMPVGANIRLGDHVYTKRGDGNLYSVNE